MSAWKEPPHQLNDVRRIAAAYSGLRATSFVRAEDKSHMEAVCACGAEFCVGCGSDAHAPATCEQARAMRNERSSESTDAATLMVMRLGSKQCPKCGIYIYKTGGCKHMTCMNASCRYEFCYHCSARWTGYDHRCAIFVRATSAPRDASASGASAKADAGASSSERQNAPVGHQVTEMARSALAAVDAHAGYLGTLEDLATSRLRLLQSPRAKNIMKQFTTAPSTDEPPTLAKAARPRTIRAPPRREDIILSSKINTSDDAYSFLRGLSDAFGRPLAAAIGVHKESPSVWEAFAATLSDDATLADWAAQAPSFPLRWGPATLRAISAASQFNADVARRFPRLPLDAIRVAVASGICTSMISGTASIVQPAFVCVTCAEKIDFAHYAPCPTCVAELQAYGFAGGSTGALVKEEERAAKHLLLQMEEARNRANTSRSICSTLCAACVATCHKGHRVRFIGLKAHACKCPQGMNALFTSRTCARHHPIRSGAPGFAHRGARALRGGAADRSARLPDKLEQAWHALHGCAACLPVLVAAGPKLWGEDVSTDVFVDALATSVQRSRALCAIEESIAIDQLNRATELVSTLQRAEHAPLHVHVPRTATPAVQSDAKFSDEYRQQIRLVGLVALTRSMLRFARTAAVVQAMRRAEARDPTAAERHAGVLELTSSAVEARILQLFASLDPHRIPLDTDPAAARAMLDRLCGVAEAALRQCAQLVEA